MSTAEPRNPFYLALLLVSLVFVINVLAVAVVPVLEDKALQAGEEPPPSPWRQALRNDGWVWLLYEVAAILLLAGLSMGLDRLRRLKKQPSQSTITSVERFPSSE